MIELRKSNSRGKTKIGWLDSKHSFSFGNYYDPAHMGFGPLRVINEDRVAPGAGFGKHPHDNMEILSYVLEGALEHKDSIGTGSVIKAGDLQRMSAGSGVQHSEFNASQTEPVHFLQIWLLPEVLGIDPSYEQKSFGSAAAEGNLRLVGSRDGRDGSLTIHQDVDLYKGSLRAADTVRHEFKSGRRGWIQVLRGEVQLGRQTVTAGDGVAIQHENAVGIEAVNDAEFLLFDMQ